MPAKEPKTQDASSASQDSPSFDTRLARLEELVGELEEGGLGLEQSLERYKEGVDLLKGCRTMLDGYRQQVEELTADAEGGTKPYAGDPDVLTDAGSAGDA